MFAHSLGVQTQDKLERYRREVEQGGLTHRPGDWRRWLILELRRWADRLEAKPRLAARLS